MKWNNVVGIIGLVSVAALGAAPLTACSSDDTTTTGGNGATVGETVSVPITAAAGGTVADKAGTVSLVIPPGALEKDTTITMTVGAQAAGTIASSYDFGPDGLKFVKPVALEIKAAVPDGKKAAVAYESGGTWKQLAGSTIDAAKGTVKASTDHFTKYSVVIVDGEVVLQPPSSCVEASSTFAACGGDPTGTWGFAEFCIDGKKLGGDPFNGKCPTATAAIDVNDPRTVTIDATTLTTSAGTIGLKTTLTIPGSCLSANNATCDQVQSSMKTAQCALSGQDCVCNESKDQPETESKQTYTTSGNTIEITDPTDGSKSTGEYCVKSNLLYFKQIGGDGILYVLDRK